MASELLFPSHTENDEPRGGSHNEELFVFGYQCKLFRDDEQAKQVDAGTYMIPWMGDEKLKIDRYDGRGHLFDLRPYDADILKGQPTPELTEDEAQIEKLCDEERYLELHTDIAEKTMYEEEEWKRYYESLAEGYKAVGFSYDGYGQQQAYVEEEEQQPKPDPEEAAFVPPKELMVPAGIPVPSSVKENAIIEKTAKFIAEHGVQMEIVMKTKQANNPQFFFMHFENTLHPYYRHLVKMIKTKKYVPKSPAKEEPHDVHNESGEGEEGSHGYLHPALMTTNRASPTPQEVYKPVPMPKVALHETPYGQLLQSFNKVNKEVAEKRKEREARMRQQVKTEQPKSPTLPATDSEYGSMPPPPGIEPVQLPGSDGNVKVKEEPQEHDESNNAMVTAPPVQIVPPPPDIQPIVDRMAMYVAKNGEEFAIVVKSKNDPRFQFLEPWHQHFQYYNFKRHLFEEEIERKKKEEEAEEKRKEQEKAEQMAKGVKFKLKKAGKEQDSNALEKKPVFGYDDSGDENDSDSTRDTKRSKSDSVSGASTPVKDQEHPTDSKTSELLERKLAEQRLKDRLAASAREKLSLVDKEKQIKAERKKKAAMFINLLKSKNEGSEDSKSSTVGEVSVSGTSSPVKTADEKSSHHKSKHKHRDRSRSRDRKSRSRSRERKHSRRSRSRSKSRTSKKKKKKRSPTPPSAYNVARRSPLRFTAPPPPPPRYLDTRSRSSRSPSHSSRHRSESRSRDKSSRKRSRSKSPSRTKSKKKKRSRSPPSKKDESSHHHHHRKSSKKKKKRSRSRERKHRDVCEVSISISDSPRVTAPEVSTLSSPGGSRTEEAQEEGEVKESSPEPGQITDTDTATRDSPLRSPSKPLDTESQSDHGRSSVHSSPAKRERSISVSSDGSQSSSHYKARSRSGSPNLTARLRSISRSKSRSLSRSVSPSNRSRLSSKSVSRSPSKSRSSAKQRSRSPSESRSRSHSKSLSPRNQQSPSRSVSREDTPADESDERLEDSNSSEARAEVNGGVALPQKNVSSYMLNRVRAIIKASRQAIREEEDMFADDT